MSRVVAWLGLLLFFLNLFIPTTYQRQKYVLLALLVAAVIVAALRAGRFALDRTIVLLTLLLAAAGLGFLALGFARGAAPGAERLATVYTLWPLVYVLLASAVTPPFLARAQRVFVVATLVIGAHTVMFALYAAGWLPGYLYVPIDVGQMIGFYSGYIELSANYTGTLLFLVPYFMATLFVLPGDAADPVPRRWAWAGFGVGLLLALISGRRGVLVAVVAAPLVIVALRLWLHRDAPWMRHVSWPRVIAAAALVGLAVIAVLGRVYGFSLAALWGRFAGGFEFATGGESAAVRGEQFFALLDAWADAPLFGWGYGTTAPGSLRSVEFPWAYELSYLSLLFHTGLVGVALYGGAVVWLYANALRAIRSGEPAMRPLFPILVGTTCFLIANATNPYLEKYDYLWVIFLPLMYVNAWRLKAAALPAAPAARP